ncbi:MAG: type II secretion system protein, partial [Verrucomicrobiota bacterium]
MTSLLNVHSLFPRRTAFSILELLVVIAIMAILAAMTMAIGPGLLRSSAMSSSLSSVASAVSLARSEAIRSRKQTYFVLAPTNTDRGFVAYAIIKKDGSDGATNYTYTTPWKKLPAG